MAKFSKCSRCQIRTRKIVRDPVTQKNIYLCPICYKLRKEKKNELPVVKVDYIMTATQVATTPPICPPEMPVASASAPAATNATAQRVPHLMEVVVIKGRKYMAICEKALIQST